MKNRIFLLVAFIALGFTALGQYNIPQNKKWAFGSNSGLDFVSGTATGITTSILTNEGCAAVADAAGNMLFYTEGTKVWDRTGAIMPSGSAIVSFTTSSCSQGAAIAPVAGNPNQYYLFSLEEQFATTSYCHLAYCIVDMTLNGGLGDVISSTLGTPITNKLAEKMTLCQGDNCNNLWLIVHRTDSIKFLAYNITAAGIAPPVVSTVGTFTATDAYLIGVMKVSPDRKHLVAQSYYAASGTELFDFNATTGVVSNCKVLDSTTMQYGAEFSPNSTKLYAEEWSTSVDQYDITGTTAAAVRATRTTVISGGEVSDLRLGPDGKIWANPSYSSTQLDCIANPDVAGTGCTYTPSAVTLAGSSYAIFGMGSQYYEYPGGGDTTIKSKDTVVCLYPTGIIINSDTSGSSYFWSNGASTSSINATALGTYWEVISNNCKINIDTIHVKGDIFTTITNASDTFLCANSAGIDLTAPSGYANYIWQDGSTNLSLHVNAPGAFYVKYDSYCKEHIDTFNVALRSLSFTLGPDVTVCSNFNIDVPVKGSDVSYRWFDGSTGSSYSASRTGDYGVTVTKGSCVASDTINVHFFHYHQNIRDTFICKGEPFAIDLVCTPPPSGTVLWNDGTTNPVKTVRDSGTYWVYVSMGECQILDTVHVVTGYCNCWYDMPTGFTPNGDGLNDIAKPRIQPGCTVSGYQFNIYNRWGELVFTSDVPGKGWDGNYKGQPADLGVYMYSLQFFIGVHDKPVYNNGSITLIR